MTVQTQLKVWDGSTRGRTEMGWRNGAHSLLFGRYFDPDRMGFRS